MNVAVRQFGPWRCARRFIVPTHRTAVDGSGAAGAGTTEAARCRVGGSAAAVTAPGGARPGSAAARGDGGARPESASARLRFRRRRQRWAARGRNRLWVQWRRGCGVAVAAVASWHEPSATGLLPTDSGAGGAPRSSWFDTVTSLCGLSALVNPLRQDQKG